jgi:two-component system CheB/CheR fusion protein
MKKDDLIYIGIGASAGGLEALQNLVNHIPVKTNFAYIVAQHLSPTYKSLLVELLSKDAPIRIKAAEDGEIVEADTMYICPPNKNIVVDEDRILLLETKEISYGPKPSVNLLFESIANAKKSKAIGIILSGTGSDGSRGIRAIKAEDGFTIAQQPVNAKYDGMPNSAINTGNIDLILDTEVMITEIMEILNLRGKNVNKTPIQNQFQVYNNIIKRVSSVKKVDFSLYKNSTIQRRIERRMAALKMVNMSNYYKYLLETVEETDLLFQDFLINVTSFFRDEEAFEALKEILKKAIAAKKDKNIRIWIPGCSTGEEPYSIAIILSEILDNKIGDYKIQIFATDLDETVIALCRKARYPEAAVINIDRNIVKKYFTVKNDEYEVIKPIRDMCIFSRHNVVADPAFMRLDLISCRNMLIYFTTELQDKIFPMFHYALNDAGILFLGKSESIGRYNYQFKQLDKKWKIYQAIYQGTKTPPFPIKLPSEKEKADRQYKEAETLVQPTIADMITDHIRKHIIPKCIIVNDSFEMIYIKGKNEFLVHPEGEITQNIFKNVHESLTLELRAALHSAKKDKNIVKSSFIKLNINTKDTYVRMIVSPLDNSFTKDLFLICFQEEELITFEKQGLSPSSEFSSEVEALQLEIAKTKEHLQTVIEELETSNEEMQSLNEELQSSNEELQSSNEELETTNEELQSTNEELQTAYTEMRSMYEERDEENKLTIKLKNELEDVNFRVNAINRITKVGIIDYHVSKAGDYFVDENFASILGYKLEDLTRKVDFMQWYESQIHPDDVAIRKQKIEELLLGKIESYNLDIRILNKNKEYIWIQCYYIGIKDANTSHVLRFVGTIKDIGDEKKIQEESVNKKEMINTLLGINLNGIYIYNFEKKCNTYINEQYTNITGYTLEDLNKLAGDKFLELYHPDELKNVLEHLNKVKKLKTNKKTIGIKYKFKEKEGNYLTLISKDTILKNDENNKPLEMIGSFVDVSEFEDGKKVTKKELDKFMNSLDIEDAHNANKK